MTVEQRVAHLESRMVALERTAYGVWSSKRELARSMQEIASNRRDVRAWIRVLGGVVDEEQADVTPTPSNGDVRPEWQRPTLSAT